MGFPLTTNSGHYVVYRVYGIGEQGLVALCIIVLKMPTDFDRHTGKLANIFVQGQVDTIWSWLNVGIRISCPCYEYPLYRKTGVCRGILFFLFLLQNIDCG